MIGSLFVAAFVASAGAASDVTFEAPVRLMAGEEPMGAKRLYPSPVMQDLDGDGKPEMVLGDLIGNLTVSRRDGETWSAPTPLEKADGEPIRFHNW